MSLRRPVFEQGGTLIDIIGEHVQLYVLTKPFRVVVQLEDEFSHLCVLHRDKVSDRVGVEYMMQCTPSAPPLRTVREKPRVPVPVLTKR